MACRDVFQYNIPQADPFDPDSLLNPDFVPDPDCIDPSFSIFNIPWRHCA